MTFKSVQMNISFTKRFSATKTFVYLAENVSLGMLFLKHNHIKPDEHRKLGFHDMIN